MGVNLILVDEKTGTTLDLGRDYDYFDANIPIENISADILDDMISEGEELAVSTAIDILTSFMFRPAHFEDYEKWKTGLVSSLEYLQHACEKIGRLQVLRRLLEFNDNTHLERG